MTQRDIAKECGVSLNIKNMILNSKGGHWDVEVNRKVEGREK